MREIEFQEVSFSYKKQKTLSEVSFSIDTAEVVGILGPNGAGKSTLLSVGATLLQPTSGKLVYGENQTQTNQQIRRRIGFVPQEIALYQQMTLDENMAFFGKLYGYKGKELTDRIKRAAEMVGLSTKEAKKIEALSGGMKRRANLAVALIHDPSLLILDEATVGIDIQSKKLILETLHRLKEQGVAIMYASHHFDEVFQLCSRMILLEEGHLISDQPIDALGQEYFEAMAYFEEKVMGRRASLHA